MLIWYKQIKKNYHQFRNICGISYSIKLSIYRSIQEILFGENRVNKIIIKVKLKNLKNCFYIRPFTSDFRVVEQIFISKDYDFTKNSSPELIIDGGAYIGLSTIYFANLFPNAHIYAVEPEETNYELLKMNTKYYRNIEAFQAGIWNKNTYLNVKNVGLGNWGFVVEETEIKETNSIESITITTLLKRSGFKKIDILKLDIEGSEKEVFSENYDEWIEKVDIFIVELHDWIKRGCSNNFNDKINRLLKSSRYQIAKIGENTVVYNNDNRI